MGIIPRFSEPSPDGSKSDLYLRPVRGCTRGAWVTAAAAAAAAAAEDGVGCFGLLTLVLLLANSSLIVCGKSGSNRTPCCKGQSNFKGQKKSKKADVLLETWTFFAQSF